MAAIQQSSKAEKAAVREKGQLAMTTGWRAWRQMKRSVAQGL
jgi:hypothetical protein